MGLLKPAIYRWAPLGVSDQRDGLSAAPGACRFITNLIHDPTSPGVLAPRPAASQVTNFPGFSNPGYVSCSYVLGCYIFGLVASTRFPGYEEPFCYNLTTSAFMPISGVTSSNVPLAAPSTGDWKPAKIANVGNHLMIAHPGATGGNMFYYFTNITPSTIASLSWAAGNTATVPLPSPPTHVEMFYNRAFYVIQNQIWMSDSLDPLTITNAGQVLFIGNSSDIVALASQPLTTGTQGILNGLLAFKCNSIYQITGDYSLGNLVINQLSGSTGTSAPRSVAQSPGGVLFMASDGIRAVNLAGTISEPLPDLVYIFYNVITPSRVAAAYVADSYRICIPGTGTSLAPFAQEYWYNFKNQKWTGPHTFAYDNSAVNGQTLYMTGPSESGAIWQMNSVPSYSDTYIENGTQLNFSLTSAPFVPAPPMSEKSFVEMTFTTLPYNQTYNITVENSQGGVSSFASSLAFTPQPMTGAQVWGQGTWGSGYWGTTPYNLGTYPLNFNAPLVFKTAMVQIAGVSGPYARIGHFTFRYTALGYTGSD